MDKATSSFDRVIENATNIVGGTSPKDRDSATKLAELDDLARANRVKERLAAIKSKK